MQLTSSLLFIVLTTLAMSETSSTLYYSGALNTEEGYTIFSGETDGFAFANRFTINHSSVLSSYSVYLGFTSNQAAVNISLTADNGNSPGESIREEILQLNPSYPSGNVYTVQVFTDCITLDEGNYWLTIQPADTSSQIIWYKGSYTTYPVSSSSDNGVTWGPTTYGVPGYAQIWGDQIFDPLALFPGDMNSDFIIDVSDIVVVVSLIMMGDEITPEEIQHSDISGDGVLDVLDIVRMVDIILNGLDSPVADFALEDINSNSPTFGEMVGPFLYEGGVSAYYFGKAG